MATRRNVTGSVNTTGRTPIQYPPEPEFTSNLTSSLIPSASVWTITYSRATPATVTDHEWVIRNVKSGEARFQGARRVENGFPFSQELTNASWQKQELNVILSSERVNNIPVYTLTDTAVNNIHYIRYSYSHIAGNRYLMSAIVKVWTLSSVQLAPPGGISLEYANFDLSNGTITGGNTSQATITPVSGATGYYRISLYYTSLITGSQVTWLIMIDSPTAPRVQTYIGTGKTILATALQIEDITGQSISLPAEYVSTNLLSSPFHGAMVDGVKYFDTDINGNTISENTLKGFLCEWARTNLFTDSEDFSLWTKAGTWVITPDATIAPDGRMTADLFTLSASEWWQSVSKSITTTASVYWYSVYVKPNGHNYVQLLASSGISSGYMNFDLLNWVVWTSSSYTGSIESLPNWWFRIKAITPTVTAATGVFIIAAVPSASASRGSFVKGTGTSWVYLWWAQLELWWVVSSYIPTTTTTVTRNIDVLTYDVRNVIANKWAFSAVFSMDDTEQFDRRALNFSWSSNNRFQFQVRRPGSANANLLYWDGATIRSVTSTQEIWTNNVAVSWTNWVGAYVFMNNTKYSSVAVPNLIFSMVDVGGGIWYPIFWCVKNVRIWKTPPTDTELLFLSNNP